MFTNPLRTVVTEPLPQAGHWTHGACISPLPPFPPWVWVPVRARRAIPSAPGPGAPIGSSASPALGRSPWLPAPRAGDPVRGAMASAVISFRLTAVRFSAVQPGQCGVAPRRLGPPCALLPTCCRVATVAGKPCGLGGGTGRFPVSSGQPCPACRGRGRVIL